MCNSKTSPRTQRLHIAQHLHRLGAVRLICSKALRLGAILHDAGIPFAYQSGYESYVPRSRVILFEAAGNAAEAGGSALEKYCTHLNQLATEGRITTVRVVCNNTLRLASRDASSFKVSHRSTFKAEECRTIIENAHAEFGAFMLTTRKLAGIKVERKLAEEMTLALLRKAESDADKVRESRGYGKILELFNGTGKGSMLETSRETAFGWLNACTEYVDHHVRAQSEENRTAAALWGQGDALKQRALEIALVA